MEATAHTWTGFRTALIEDGELLVNTAVHLTLVHGVSDCKHTVYVSSVIQRDLLLLV